MDKDLRSIQEARDLMVAARDAQRIWALSSQEKVDRVCAAMAQVAFDASARLGLMAVQESGYGVPEHKRLKNEFSSKTIWESIRDVKTVGVIEYDQTRKLYKIAWPMGVVVALTPSTNPTSTVMFKILIAIKALNAIVLAPHPATKDCCYETTKLMADAAVAAGAPPGLVACMRAVSLPGTNALMEHKYTSVILATGGTPMVRAAHSKGKPAYGVGPGNVPVYVDRSADLKRAAKYITASKAFDYSTICATEQAVIADGPIARELEALMKAEGAYFLNATEADKIAKILFDPKGAINAAMVGKSPQHLASQAGFHIPDSSRILVAKLNKVGPDEPLSREKLTTVLGWYEADGWEAGCEICLDLIFFGGRGHSLIIHAEDEDVIMAFGLEKPVHRIGINTMGTLGVIGLTTGMTPSMTLGSGGVGGSITGDNITVHHLYTVKQLAYETRPPPSAALVPGSSSKVTGTSTVAASKPQQDIETMVREVVSEIMRTTK